MKGVDIMKAKVIGTNIIITDSLEARINEHIEKLNKKYIHNKEDIIVKVLLTVEKETHICEVNVDMYGKHYTITKSSKDMYDSISETFNKLDRMIRQDKERFISNKRHNSLDEIIEEEEFVEEEFE